ncbi:sugar O-acetyltransferase [Sporichthya brevicatena]|uniref:Sugar O-acetyltransferase n=1 Tax=Sporichthya brevicatena TaxID=171442 RepID=A0ABN1G5S5_9ACTN
MDERTMRDRMLAGEPYIADETVAADNRRAMTLAEAYNRTSVAQPKRRREILTGLFAAIGEGTEIRPPLFVDYGYRTTVGARTFANFGLVILDVAPVVIGDDVQIGPNVQLLTATHPLEPGPRREKWESAEPITIGDNVWLGGGVIVCPGVTIGPDTVVGAGSVVTKDLPAGVLAVGVPARVVRELT